MRKRDFQSSLAALALCLSILSCSQRKLESLGGEQSTKDNQPVAIVEQAIRQPDVFHKAIYQFSLNHPDYNQNGDQLVDTISQLSEHWFLKTIEQAQMRYSESEDPLSIRQIAMLPTQLEMELINRIRSGSFSFSSPNQNDIVFEDWQFGNSSNAELWLVLLNDSLRTNDYTKPPRFQWVEDSSLYLVSTRNAQQWSEMSDSLVMILAGKTKVQLSNIYEPLDIKHFKKWQGPANSTVIKTQQHLFQENLGPHYSYFYFVKQRLSGDARAQSREEFPSRTDFNITTSLHHPFTGQEQFDSIKETLVGIQCKIEEPALNNLNIVGKTLPDLKERFGEILYTQDDITIFGHSNRIVVTEMKSDLVRAFKYLRLKEPFSALKSNEDIRNTIVTFE